MVDGGLYTAVYAALASVKWSMELLCVHSLPHFLGLIRIAAATVSVVRP